MSAAVAKRGETRGEIVFFLRNLTSRTSVAAENTTRTAA